MKSKLRQVKDLIFSLDTFGQDVGFSIHGKRKLLSLPGLIVSLTIFMTVGAYFIQKFNKMIDYGDTKH